MMHPNRPAGLSNVIAHIPPIITMRQFAAIEPRHKVHFVDQPTVFIVVDHVRPQEEANVWYSMEYLESAFREQIKNNLRDQYYQNDTKNQVSSPRSSAMQNDAQTCWRGLEYVLERYNRHDKASVHAKAVILKQHSLMTQHLPASPCDKEHQLGRFAMDHSKADRANAIRRAQEDESFTQQGIKTMTMMAGAVLHDPNRIARERGHQQRQHPQCSFQLLGVLASLYRCCRKEK